MRLLFVDCCVSQRGADARTRALCAAFLEGYHETHPVSEIETLDLQKLELKPFRPLMLDDRDALGDVGAFDSPVFKLARQFKAADHILVGAPFWDLSYPALLRIYIEYISAKGVTYHYDEQGCHGDCAAQRLAYLTTGGDREKPGSLGVEHWRQLSEMFGIKRFDHVFAGGLDLGDGRTETLLSAACDKARLLGETF